MIATQNEAYASGTLETLQPSGVPPKTRIASAGQAYTMVLGLLRNDETRARKRALTKGLVDGNPPYSPGKLKEAGRAKDCNVNFRIPEAYRDAATGAFYDLSHEAPQVAEVTLDYTITERKAEWEGIIEEEFDCLVKEHGNLGYNMPISQNEMVWYGSGPLFFLDDTDWRPVAVEHRDWYVPEMTKSDAKQYEWGALIMTYRPHELYDRIENKKAAETMGWKIRAVQAAIIQAAPEDQRMIADQSRGWEWWQQQIKNGSLNYSFGSKVIRVAHVFWKEFDGKISHGMVTMDQSAVQPGGKPDDWLFHKEGRFSDWPDLVHPMYYDHGGGGFHHSVAGMGVKMYGAMEWQNRLLCNLMDKVFAPKVLFKPTTADARQKLALTHLGDYGSVPSGWDVMQTPVTAFMDEGLMFNRVISDVVSSNLSQYRQDLRREKGNPLTATGEQIRASEQARLGKTQLNRYYDQYDALLSQMYRRAVSSKQRESSPGGKEALEFQKRCTERGVPIEVLRKPKKVQAVRVAGQGSPFMRQQALDFILGIVGMLPEGGRQAVIEDSIAARVGQSNVRRYFPAPAEDTTALDQAAEAQDKVAAMKVGLTPMVTPTQNALIYAQTYLQAGAQAAASLEQGANPAEVAAFLDIVGVATAAQLQRMAQDETRQPQYKALEAQWKELAKQADQIREMAAEQQPAQPAQPQPTADEQATMAKAKLDMEIKAAKAQQLLQQKQAKFEQEQALNDAKTASEIAEPQGE